VNVAGGKPTRGVQIASFLNVSVDTLEGLQMAIGNYSDHVKGLQLGVANMCEGSIVGGTQVGLINYSRDTTFVFKVGLVNINPNTRIRIVTTGGILDYVNLAVKFSNKPIYSMIGFGLPYNIENEDISLTLNYRLGTSINLHKYKWFLNPDFGYSHIISDSESTEKYGTKFALRLRLSLEYQIIKRMGAFITGGVSWDSEYGNVRFNTKGIFEAGLTFTLTKVV
jgi:hypothetical protein